MSGLRSYVEHAVVCALEDDIAELQRLVVESVFGQGRALGDRVTEIIANFFSCLSRIYDPVTLKQQDPKYYLSALGQLASTLKSDVEAALINDPATDDPFEVILCYPGFKAVSFHRIAHIFYREGVPLLPRMIAEYAHGQTGIDIHPGATIGPYFFIDHGTGVVIGETATIGKSVTIYQGVTLGAKRFQRDALGAVVKGQPRHPEIGDRVTIYSGATVLGRIHIGEGSVIGGNVWLTESVPAKSRITQSPPQSSYFTDGSGI
jgi:serine O-acetyltransferase